jgi:hypothetical protein
MGPLDFAILTFVGLEAANIAALYFRPNSKLFNAMGVFRAWNASKADPEVHDLVRYLTNWVAGTKLIFLALLLVIVALGDHRLKQVAVAALILAILSFFWRLFPLIRRIDDRGGLEPPGYSRTLGIMIVCFVAGLSAALVFG